MVLVTLRYYRMILSAAVPSCANEGALVPLQTFGESFYMIFTSKNN